MTLNQNELRTLVAALDGYGVEVPKDVAAELAAATALRETAEAALAAIRAEIGPDLSAVAAATAGEFIDARVAATTRDTREAAAHDLIAEGTRRWTDTGQRLASVAMPGLAPAFDALAEKFTALLDDLDGNVGPAPRVGAAAEAFAEIGTVATALAGLAAIRDNLSRDNRAPLAHPGVERVTRLHDVPDITTAQRLVRMIEGGAWGQAAIAERIALPGVTLAWHVPSEQLRFDDLPVEAGTPTAVG